jgi:hypothetical protein
MPDLATFAANVTSQSGEDGILAEVFRRIGVAHRSCVEFGAWDGKYLSNTWPLWHDQGWRAVLIEGHAERHAALVRSLGDFPRVSAVCAYVQPEGESSLDNLLARSGLEQDFDLLSIDVDGDDYHIWRGLSGFRPRVVVVEYNPTIPPELALVQRKGGYFGASARALEALAADKGYRLAACTKTNCIFVDARLWGALGVGHASLEQLFPRGHLTYVISAYDGRTYLSRVPTYAEALPTATSPLSPAEPSGQLVPVRIFGGSVLRSLWRAFVRTRAGAPVGRLRESWSRKRHDNAALAAWERQGRPVPPPHAHKQRVLREYADRHGLGVLVETGTYLGDMVNAVRGEFRQIYSIELDPALQRRAAERFADRENITILQGDSARVLPALLAQLDSPALFWLDGHYSADITAKGEKDTPIVSELEGIAAHSLKGHVILIDDARCFNGTHDYPTLKELEGIARRHWPASSFEVQDDIIRIAPSR